MSCSPQNTRYVIEEGAKQRVEEYDPAEAGTFVLGSSTACTAIHRDMLTIPLLIQIKRIQTSRSILWLQQRSLPSTNKSQKQLKADFRLSRRSKKTAGQTLTRCPRSCARRSGARSASFKREKRAMRRSAAS